MANKRVFYAAKKAGIGPVGAAGGGGENFRQLHGIQSVGITTTFNLEQTFELGQLAIYENIEGIPDVSIDIEKVLDGYCPVYLLATGLSDGASAAAAATLVGRSTAACDFVLATYKDTDQIAGGEGATANDRNLGNAAGAAESHVMCSGVFVSSVAYNIGIDGDLTESVSLVGQDKVYFGHAQDNVENAAKFSSTDFIGAEDEPRALTVGSGGVQRRENVVFKYGDDNNSYPNANLPGNITNSTATANTNPYPASGLGTVLPKQVPGVSASGTNEKDSDGNFNCLIQSMNVSTDFGREDIFQLGRKGRFHRYVNFPTEVTCEITVVSQSGDLISATEQGTLGAAKPGDNLLDETIRLQLEEGLLVDLGKKNKLSSVSITGGDAGGGNEEISYSFTNFNDFAVYHPEDPKLKSATSATATIAFTNAIGPAGAKFTITAADGTSRVFTAVSSSEDSSANPPTFQGGASGTATATNLKAAIEAAVNGAGGGLGGKVTVEQSTNTLTLTQATGGVEGNTTITVADQSSTTVSINGASAASTPTGSFTGGTGGAKFSPKGNVYQ